MIPDFRNVPGTPGGVNPETARKTWTSDPSGWAAPAVPSLGPRVWVVLGGGGTKGLAHVGAWQALVEAGVPVAGVVGTSIGALVGALVAGGLGWEAMAPLALALRRTDIARLNRRAVLVNGIRQESVLQGEPLRRHIERVLPVARWEDLGLPLQVNAVDLETGATVWFGTGADTTVPLADALYASAALPVLYPPARVAGRVLVDGGVGDTLAIGRAAELGATGVIAVDAGAGPVSPAGPVLAQGLPGIHQRVFSILAGRRRAEALAAWSGPPLLAVRPRLDGYGTFDFGSTRYFLEEGYRATRAALSGGPADPA